MRVPVRFHLWWNAHAQTLNKKQVDGDEDRNDAGKNGDMESEEACERGARNLFSAAQKDHDGLADEGNLSSNLSAHLGGKEGQRIPGQQIAAEAESHHQKKQNHAGDPGQLPGLAIGFEEYHAEHMHKGREDHQIG